MNKFNNSDSWDWEWFRYGSTVILKKTDDNWGLLTPREFNSLMRVHAYVNDPKSKDKIEKDKLTPIDKVPGL